MLDKRQTIINTGSARGDSWRRDHDGPERAPQRRRPPLRRPRQAQEQPQQQEEQKRQRKQGRDSVLLTFFWFI